MHRPAFDLTNQAGSTAEEPPKRNSKGQWLPGQTGNAGGRAKGSGWAQETRAKLREASGPVLRAALAGALAGDPACMRLILERTLPPLRPGDDLVTVEAVGTTLAEKALSIVDAALRSELTPAQAGDLLAHLGAAARIVEIDELQRRIEALEALASPK